MKQVVAARTAVAAVAGGTASVLAGGKFANGAITGAFAQLYNADGIGKSFAVGGGRALGAIFGGIVGTGTAGLCTAGTYGACGTVTPGIIMTGVVGGALVGGQTAGVIYDAVSNVLGGEVYSKTEDSSPETVAVDSKGNAIPLQEGEYLTGSPDGKWIQVRKPDGDPRACESMEVIVR
ncbi:MAG: hypothetical protein R3D51_00125 [Hyphomicrobiaceae bacterium]